MSPRILVVDDEPAIREAVSYALEREGWEVSEEADGAAALETALAEPFDAVVLDLMLPGVPGTEVCRRLRAASAVPILLVTARGTEVDRIVGLELGADDYVTKPFSVAELLARIRAILRRRDLDRTEARAVRRVGGVELDLTRHVVTVDGRDVELTPSEFKLLALLSRQPERAVTRREIVSELWQSEHVGDERAADAHVVNLRRKLERDPARPERIVTVRGHGYKLVPV
jgi:two-component system, OmpR family, response regulator RegX3